jgi:hypothetical protein
VVEVLGDGTYLTVLVNPKIQGARRRRIVDAVRSRYQPTHLHGASTTPSDVATPSSALPRPVSLLREVPHPGAPHREGRPLTTTNHRAGTASVLLAFLESS